MAFGNSPRATRDRPDEPRRIEEQQAFLATPVGQAVLAKQRRQRFFEIQLPISYTMRDPNGVDAGLMPQTLTTPKANPDADVLGEIESVGWRLEHVGYVRHLDADRREGTVGIYLFRAVDLPDPGSGG